MDTRWFPQGTSDSCGWGHVLFRKPVGPQSVGVILVRPDLPKNGTSAVGENCVDHGWITQYE
ncbi:hypothetical protein DDE05_47255, partial [Streptomyces cavourensis]